MQQMSVARWSGAFVQRCALSTTMKARKINEKGCVVVVRLVHKGERYKAGGMSPVLHVLDYFHTLTTSPRIGEGEAAVILTTSDRVSLSSNASTPRNIGEGADSKCSQKRGTR